MEFSRVGAAPDIERCRVVLICFGATMKQGPDVLFNTSSGRRILMDRDYEFDEGYDGTSNVSRTDESMANKSGTESGLDPMDIANPFSAYFLLRVRAKITSSR